MQAVGSPIPEQEHAADKETGSANTAAKSQVKARWTVGFWCLRNIARACKKAECSGLFFGGRVAPNSRHAEAVSGIGDSVGSNRAKIRECRRFVKTRRRIDHASSLALENTGQP